MTLLVAQDVAKIYRYFCQKCLPSIHKKTYGGSKLGEIPCALHTQGPPPHRAWNRQRGSPHQCIARSIFPP